MHRESTDGRFDGSAYDGHDSESEFTLIVRSRDTLTHASASIFHIPSPLSLNLYYVIPRSISVCVRRDARRIRAMRSRLPRSAQRIAYRLDVGSNIESILFLYARRDNSRNYTQLSAPCNFVSVKALLAARRDRSDRAGQSACSVFCFSPIRSVAFPFPRLSAIST